MSGRKQTKIELVAERLFVLGRLVEIRGLMADLVGVRGAMHRVIDAASEEELKLAKVEADGSRAWLAETEDPDVGYLAVDSDDQDVERVANLLRRMIAKGRKLREELIIGLNQHGDEARRNLETRVAASEGRLLAAEDLLCRWGRTGSLAPLRASLGDAREQVRVGRYDAASETLESLDKDVREAAKDAVTLEESHQKRLYLLKALRQVCADMGFTETGAPVHTNPEDRSSPIAFTVDTVTQGRIDFDLALDAARCFSEMEDERCFHDFAEISKHLEEAYGIRTAFRREDGEAPILRQRGEKDLPDGATEDRAAKRGGR